MTTKDAPDWQTVVLPIVVVSTAPSPVVIAPNRLTTVQRAYLAGSTGTVDLVAAPQPSPISVVQQAIGISTDQQTVQISLPQTPTVGNLLVLMLAMGSGVSANALPSRWTQNSPTETVGAAWTPVQSGDTSSFDISVCSGSSAIYGFVAMLYEIAGADLTTPITDTASAAFGSTYTSMTSSVTTTNINEFGLMVGAFIPTPADPVPITCSGTVDGTAAPVTYDGTAQYVGFSTEVGQAAFMHGPLSVSQSVVVTTTMSLPTGTAGVSYGGGWLIMLNPGSSPISQTQIRVWALDILGSSTDQPYIERNDSLATLLSTTGPISRWVSFEPGGLLLPAGTGLTATAVDSADFGAVWQPA